MGQAWTSRSKSVEELLPPRGVALVIEPDADKRADAADALRDMGFKTHETGCGAVGQFIATQLELAVVLVNAVLPDMSGLKLIKRIRTLSPDALIVATSPPGGAWETTAGLASYAGADVALSAFSSETLGWALHDVTVSVAVEARAG